MNRILKKIITKCKECPYCRYDSYYDMSSNSGYDCQLSDKRIVSDGDGNIDLIPIPEWCDLDLPPENAV